MAAASIIPLDYEGSPIQFESTGWFNATVAARRWGMRPVEWLRLPSTKEYIAAIEKQSGKIPLWRTRRGGTHSGTWLSPKLAVIFARWLDVNFAVWCDQQIDLLLRCGPSNVTLSKRRIDYDLAKRDYKERGALGSSLMHECKLQLPSLKAEAKALDALGQPSLFGWEVAP